MSASAACGILGPALLLDELKADRDLGIAARLIASARSERSDGREIREKETIRYLIRDEVGIRSRASVKRDSFHRTVVV